MDIVIKKNEFQLPIFSIILVILETLNIEKGKHFLHESLVPEEKQSL